MNEKDYLPGVYLLSERSGDGKSPVIYFNGTDWWLPGWECRMKLTDDYNGAFSISRDRIGELVWEDK